VDRFEYLTEEAELDAANGDQAATSRFAEMRGDEMGHRDAQPR